MLPLPFLHALWRAGVLRPTGPRNLWRIVRAWRTWGTSLATLSAIAAVRYPDRPAVVDDAGVVTHAELATRTAAIAEAVRAELGPGRTLAVLCRNHRGVLEAAVVAARLGADLVLLNTALSPTELGRVLDRERPALVVADEEFTGLLGSGVPVVVGWGSGGRTLDGLAAGPVGKAVRVRPGRVTLLTSGTTGTPRSVRRTTSLRSLRAATATLLTRTPLRVGTPLVVAPPLCHGLGFGFLGLSLLLGGPLVLSLRFDPDRTLAAVDHHPGAALVVVPAMLCRLLDRKPVTPSAALCAGSPLSAELAIRALDAFGEVVHNLYGSTETGFCAIATPTDLRAAPGTVGRPVLGARLSVVDGTVRVGGPMLADGSTPLDTGDLGRFDADGRLFLIGRADDMVITGGENVHPQEVEDVLVRHSAVADAAVVGVPDEEYGQRLVAFVVPGPGPVPDPSELTGHVLAHLARFKAPREVVFVEALPRNPIGKLQRARLSPLWRER